MVVLCETWLGSAKQYPRGYFDPNFEVLEAHRPTSERGRPCGGVLVAVRRTANLSPKLVWSTQAPESVWITLPKAAPSREDLVIGAVYMPPEGSTVRRGTSPVA